jgi:hypothetical protein
MCVPYPHLVYKHRGKLAGILYNALDNGMRPADPRFAGLPRRGVFSVRLNYQRNDGNSC